jgi:lipid-A-disaccharide synthase
MAEKTMGLLCLFPFEPPYFQVHDLPATFIGHPLAQRLPLVPDKHALRVALGLNDAPVVALLPGSRRSEWRYHAALFFDVVRKMQQTQPDIQVIVPCLHEHMKDTLMPFAQDLSILWMVDAQGASQALTSADVALVVSGTASLETALCHTPMVVAYRMHALSHAIISRLLLSRWVALPNIVANSTIVPEFLQSQATVDTLSQAVTRLLCDDAARAAQCRAFDVIHQQLMPPSDHIAAQTLIDWWRMYAR